MKYPKPQKGNPHSLTIDQHVFPARSLQRFTDSRGTVHVLRKGWTAPKRLPPHASMFCAKRAWDQRAEHGYMKDIEDRYQPLADEIVSGRSSLGPAEHTLMSEFYALWRLRAEHRENPQPDQQMRGVTPTNFTDEQREHFEKHGVLFHDENGALPGRMFGGMVIQMGIDRMTDALKGKEWGIVVALAGEFIVPDYIGTLAVIPLCPKQYLIAGAGNLSLSIEEVAQLNGIVTTWSRRYVVARSFAKSPIKRIPAP